MAFSWTVDLVIPLVAMKAEGTPFLMSGTFTDAQTGGSAMEFGRDYGVVEVKQFFAYNLTDTDETVQITHTDDDTVTIATVTNDDDGRWIALVVKQ